jgi:aryl-alcohol dehydrogenase-like predicted oxidoreductase
VLTARGVPLLSNQIEYSLLHRMPETTGLIAACRELGVRILAYSPLAMGRLTGKYTTQQQLDSIAGSRKFGAVTAGQLAPVVAKLQQIGQAHGGKTPAMVALRWVIQKGAIPIAGAKNAAQATENAGALGWAMSDAEMAELDAVSLPGYSSFWQGSSK